MNLCAKFQLAVMTKSGSTRVAKIVKKYTDKLLSKLIIIVSSIRCSRLIITLFLCSTIFKIVRSQRLEHIAVIENDAFEQQTLPSYFRNPFYKTPRVREVLAKSSWFGEGEMPVFDRDAEKIPRSEIYSVLYHAGLIQRKNFNI